MHEGGARKEPLGGNAHRLVASLNGLGEDRAHEKERDVLGAGIPRGKGSGDAHSEIRDIFARARRHLQELLSQAAPAASLDKDELR